MLLSDHRGQVFETRYNEFAVAIRPLKPGIWFRDELERADKIYAREKEVITRYLDVRGKRVMDFGCGAGASSVAYGWLGAEVIGVEPDANLAAAGQVRVREDGLSGLVQILHVPDTTQLPFPDAYFDVCICNAVLEHIPPAQRSAHVREIWRTLRPGGYLYVTETPNRLFPYDAHTTRLWWVPWMPLPLARRYAIWRRRVEPLESEHDLVLRGIRGVTVWEITSGLDNSCYRFVKPSGVDEIEAHFDFRRRQSRLRLLAKGGYVALMHVLETTICRWLHIPIVALLPDLTFCIQKLPVEGA
ncbi:MAG: class I SAM-dependent methyltransferase [Chloroflexi bacterium]|nr:class I SAM-dependent methyltransferase [Chloroflexota bacterium]